MGLLAQWDQRVKADVSWQPLDERWYVEYPGIETEAGISVSSETVLRCGTVLAALTFRSESYALCEPQVFERDGDSRRPTPDHYLQVVLRDPNAWQTGGEWMGLQGYRLGIYGNSYNRIISSRTSVVDQLWPLEPARVRILEQHRDGTLTYEYRPKIGEPEPIGHDEMLHFRGLSIDGIRGVDMAVLIRQAVGIALAAERHEAKFLSRGVRLSGILSTENDKLSKETRDRAIASWNDAFSGHQGTGGTAMLEGGYKFTPMTSGHRDAQFVELRDFQVGEILRALGVPGVVVGYAEKTATYASASEFFKYGLRRRLQDWLGPIERRISKVLLMKGDRHFLRFNMDNALRGATEERIAALVSATGGKPIYTQNEARAIEDMNPAPEPSADQLGQPLNMSSGAPKPAEPKPGRVPPPPPEDEDGEEAKIARGWRFAHDAAARVVRKEVLAFAGDGERKGIAFRYAKDAQGFRLAATDWYGKHADTVSAQLHIDRAAAALYCQRQLDSLIERGVAATATWESEVVPQLAAIAYGD
jgi:HK97 family phage portal protein